MTKRDLESTKKWVEAWKKAGPELERIRRNELRKVSTQKALMILSDMFESCRLHFKPRPTSGLIQQQAWFRRFRK